MRPPSRPSAHSGAPTLAFSLGRAPQGRGPQFIFPTVPQALLSRGIKTMLMTADTGQGLLKGHTPTGMHGGFARLHRPLSLRVCLRLRCPISRARPCPDARGPDIRNQGPPRGPTSPCWPPPPGRRGGISAAVLGQARTSGREQGSRESPALDLPWERVGRRVGRKSHEETCRRVTGGNMGGRTGRRKGHANELESGAAGFSSRPGPGLALRPLFPARWRRSPRSGRDRASRAGPGRPGVRPEVSGRPAPGSALYPPAHGVTPPLLVLRVTRGEG